MIKVASTTSKVSPELVLKLKRARKKRISIMAILESEFDLASNEQQVKMDVRHAQGAIMSDLSEAQGFIVLELPSDQVMKLSEAQWVKSVLENQPIELIG